GKFRRGGGGGGKLVVRVPEKLVYPLKVVVVPV
ncbi:unnamed protein product, partial [Rotaria sp. Silwood1]